MLSVGGMRGNFRIQKTPGTDRRDGAHIRLFFCLSGGTRGSGGVRGIHGRHHGRIYLT